MTEKIVDNRDYELEQEILDSLKRAFCRKYISKEALSKREKRFYVMVDKNGDEAFYIHFYGLADGSVGEYGHGNRRINHDLQFDKYTNDELLAFQNFVNDEMYKFWEK